MFPKKQNKKKEENSKSLYETRQIFIAIYIRTVSKKFNQPNVNFRANRLNDNLEVNEVLFSSPEFVAWKQGWRRTQLSKKEFSQIGYSSKRFKQSN